MLDKKIVFVKDWGAYVRVNKGMITCVVKDEVKWSLSPAEISSIIILANSSISSEVINLANQYGIEIVFFKGNEPIAKIIPASYAGSFKLWLRQIRAWKSKRVNFAREFIYGKLHNQWITLRYYEKKYNINLNSDKLLQLEREVLVENTVEGVMQKEAEGAKWYWSGVRQLVPKELGFKGRKKRGEAKDPFNIALNIGYGMLRKSVWGAIISVGLNPYLGFLHKYRAGRPSLVLDLMEEFRSPFVDRKLIGIARQNPEDVKDIKVIYTNMIFEEEEIYTQARRLANVILHDEEYKPYMAK